MAILDEASRHEVYLAKLTTQILNSKVYPSIDAAFKVARNILINADSTTSLASLKRVQKEIGKNVSEAYREGLMELTEDLSSLAAYESEYSANLSGNYAGLALAVPAAEKVDKYVMNSILTVIKGNKTQSGVWLQYVEGAINSLVSSYNGTIAAGFQQGQTIGQMVKTIRDDSEGIIKREAEALARTGQSHFATQAREAMALENSDVIKYRVFVATFDNRTTLTCRKFDAHHWAIDDETYPRIPLHFNCRSSYVFVVDVDDATLGRKSAVGGKQADDINPNRKLKYRGKRDVDIFKPGSVDAGLTQDQWMKQQPDWFQESALGPTRAKLFRDGGVTLDRFTDMVGKPITLKQLKELDAQAFEKAGLIH